MGSSTSGCTGRPPAPYRALDLLARAKAGVTPDGLAAEDDALADLVMGEELRSGLYAFDLVQRRAKRPAGAPGPGLARDVTKVGIVGAGLMASQLALLFVRRLEVPVVLTDLDQARVDKGLSYVHGEIDKLVAKKRLDAGKAAKLHGLVTGSVDTSVFADADLVIEAVFEELAVKQQVWAERGEGGLARVRAGHQHVVAVGDRDGGRPRAPRAGGRSALLQPGRAHAAAGDRARGADRRRDAGHRLRRRQGAEEVLRAGQGRARVRGQPAARSG